MIKKSFKKLQRRRQLNYNRLPENIQTQINNITTTLLEEASRLIIKLKGKK